MSTCINNEQQTDFHIFSQLKNDENLRALSQSILLGFRHKTIWLLIMWSPTFNIKQAIHTFVQEHLFRNVLTNYK
jgi:hypothetical protein